MGQIKSQAFVISFDFWQDISRSHKELGIGFSPIVFITGSLLKMEKKRKETFIT